MYFKIESNCHSIGGREQSEGASCPEGREFESPMQHSWRSAYGEMGRYNGKLSKVEQELIWILDDEARSPLVTSSFE